MPPQKGKRAVPVARDASLYTHKPHPHTPRNANHRHAAERQAKIAQGGASGFNERIAINLSNAVSTMWMAYAFAALAIITIFAVLGFFGVISPLVAAIGAAVSQTFIQLVFLPILALVSRVQGRHTEIQSDEQYHAVLRILHELAETMRHLNAQDNELLEHREILTVIARAIANASSRSPVSPASPASPPSPSSAPPPLPTSPTRVSSPSSTPPRPKRPRSLAPTSPTTGV